INQLAYEAIRKRTSPSQLTSDEVRRDPHRKDAGSGTTVVSGGWCYRGMARRLSGVQLLRYGLQVIEACVQMGGNCPLSFTGGTDGFYPGAGVTIRNGLL